MPKKIFLTILVLAILSFTAVYLFAEGGELSYELIDSSSYRVTGSGSFRGKVLEIPSEYDGKAVTQIAPRAFENNKNLTTVIIPSSVTYIGDFAFSGCVNLTDVNIAEGLDKLDWGVFYNCTGLKNVVLPSTVSFISDWCFYNCSSLESIHVPENVSIVGIGVFSSCSSLKYVNIPLKITDICQYFFADCISLESINIPSNITYIQEYAFADCESLADVTFVNSKVGIHSQAFFGDIAICHYPCGDSKWVSFKFGDYGGDLTWTKHDSKKHVDRVEATETSSGNIEYWYCPQCDEYYKDELCSQKISLADTIIPCLSFVRGDVDGNGKINEADVLQCLYHLFFADEYAVNQNIDFNDDGIEKEDDVLLLLYNVFFGDEYPLLGNIG